MTLRRRAVAVLLSALLGIVQAHTGARARTYTVTVENMMFTPAVLSVRRGDRIVWVNKDLFPHTITADSKAFDSGGLVPDASWTYSAVAPGEYAYSCVYHPSMKGRIIVR